VRKRSDAEQADIAVARAAAGARGNILVRAFGRASEIADQPPLITLCAATFAAGLVTGNRPLARAGGRMLAAELLATKFKSLIKHRVDRTRPHVLADGGRYRAERGHDRDPALSSFPSGHMAGAVAVARAFAREYPERRLAAYAGAAGIGAIQIPRCKHYPADIAAGTIVGLLAETIVHLSERMVQRGLGHSSSREGRAGADGSLPFSPAHPPHSQASAGQEPEPAPRHCRSGFETHVATVETAGLAVPVIARG